MKINKIFANGIFRVVPSVEVRHEEYKSKDFRKRSAFHPTLKSTEKNFKSSTNKQTKRSNEKRRSIVSGRHTWMLMMIVIIITLHISSVFSPLPTHISCPLIRFTIIFLFYSCPFTQTLTLFYTSLVRVATSPFTFAAVTEPPTQFRTPMPSPLVYPETDHGNNFYGLHSESSC